MIQVIGLAGLAGSGKNYVANEHFRPLGFRPVALADHFKIGAVGKGKASLEEVMHTKPAPIRTYLQEEGTEFGRMLYGETVWVKTLYAWMEHWFNTCGDRRFVITDIRFPDEIDFIHEHGGLVYQILAPKRAEAKLATFEESQRGHISEHALRDKDHLYDGVIQNDPGFTGLVGAQVRALLHAHKVLDDAPWLKLV